MSTHDVSEEQARVLGMRLLSEATEKALGATKVYRYAQISQGMSHLVHEHYSNIPERFLYTRCPEKSWGCGTFLIKDDGFLVLIEHDYDSSDCA